MRGVKWGLLFSVLLAIVFILPSVSSTWACYKMPVGATADDCPMPYTYDSSDSTCCVQRCSDGSIPQFSSCSGTYSYQQGGNCIAPQDYDISRSFLSIITGNLIKVTGNCEEYTDGVTCEDAGCNWIPNYATYLCSNLNTESACKQYDTCTPNYECSTNPNGCYIDEGFLLQLDSTGCVPGSDTKYYYCSSTGDLSTKTCPLGQHCEANSCVPIPETCDGIDNDNDGQVDEGTDLCPVGEQCVSGSCQQPLSGTCEYCSTDSDCSSNICSSKGVCLPSTSYCAWGVGDGCDYLKLEKVTLANGCTQTCQGNDVWGSMVCPEETTITSMWSKNSAYIDETVSRSAYVTGTSSGSVLFSGDGGTASMAFSSEGSVSGGSFTPSSTGTYYFTASVDGVSDQSGALSVIEREVVCGNNIKETGETCDYNNKPTCSPGTYGVCTFCSDGTYYPECEYKTLYGTSGYSGDGICQLTYESCTHSDCLSDSRCQPPEEPSDPVCDDGVKEDPEECDYGDSLNGVQCSADYGDSCTFCSDGCTLETIQGESCSDGIENGDEGGVDCGGTECSDACVVEEDPVTICSEYTNQTACESDPANVATTSVGPIGENQVAECVWENDVCDGNVVSYTPEGDKIGSCLYVKSETADTCEDGFLSYSWDAQLKWDDDANSYNFPTPSDVPEGYVQDSEGVYHYDPQETWKTCVSGQRSIPCPAQIQLNYFTWKNLLAAALVVLIAYLLINNKRKKENNKTKTKPATKKKPQTKKAVSKKKTLSKKTSKKRK